MKVADFQKLITDAGLNLHLSYAGRFVVTLRIENRIQCCTLVLDPRKSEDEAKAYLAGKKAELEDAAKTQQGRMAEERAQKAQTKPVQKKQDTRPVAMNYPAH